MRMLFLSGEKKGELPGSNLASGVSPGETGKEAGLTAGSSFSGFYRLLREGFLREALWCL